MTSKNCFGVKAFFHFFPLEFNGGSENLRCKELMHGGFFFIFFYFVFYPSDTTSVTAVAASHTSKFFWRRPLRVTAVAASHTSGKKLRQKKIAERFFLASSTARHRSLGRIDRGAHVTAVAASHTSEKKLRQKKIAERFFFGVDRCASQLAWTNRP